MLHTYEKIRACWAEEAERHALQSFESRLPMSRVTEAERHLTSGGHKFYSEDLCNR